MARACRIVSILQRTVFGRRVALQLVHHRITLTGAGRLARASGDPIGNGSWDCAAAALVPVLVDIAAAGVFPVEAAFVDGVIGELGLASPEVLAAATWG